MFFAASVHAEAVKDFTLPLTKQYIETCRAAALARHPGTIESYEDLHKGGVTFMQYGIRDDKGHEWNVVCDGSTGKIIKSDALVDQHDLPRPAK